MAGVEGASPNVMMIGRFFCWIVVFVTSYL